MKTIYAINEAVGSDGLQVEGAIKVDQSVLKLEVNATYPVEKIIAPATKLVDELLDKIEKIIPGDQTGMVQRLKDEYKTKLIEAITKD